MQREPVTTGGELTAEHLCRSIYEATAALYAEKSQKIAGQGLGFRILYGPPILRPEYLLLGYQPGGRANSVREDQHLGWPIECEYAFAKSDLKAAGWARPGLALNMQKVWGIATLKKSAGLNAVFFRAPNVKEWNSVHTDLRDELAAFSTGNAQQIVDALQPKRLIVIGFDTYRLITNGSKMQELLPRASGGALVRLGKVWGRPALVTLHLTGAHGLSEIDFRTMRAFFASLNSN